MRIIKRKQCGKWQFVEEAIWLSVEKLGLEILNQRTRMFIRILSIGTLANSVVYIKGTSRPRFAKWYFTSVYFAPMFISFCVCIVLNCCFLFYLHLFKQWNTFFGDLCGLCNFFCYDRYPHNPYESFKKTINGEN